MFDIGFWELTVISVIALLVVGPERLPAMARTLGLWVGRLRRYVSHVKEDIEREIRAEELRDMMKQTSKLGSIGDSFAEAGKIVDDFKRDVEDFDEPDDKQNDIPAEQPPSEIDEATSSLGEALTGGKRGEAAADDQGTGAADSGDQASDHEQRSE
jgi:sec-independent protein translocase protein TatB